MSVEETLWQSLTLGKSTFTFDFRHEHWLMLISKASDLVHRAEVTALICRGTMTWQGIFVRSPIPVVMVAKHIVPGHLQRWS